LWLASAEIFDAALIEEAEELVSNLAPSSPTPMTREALNQPSGLVMISGVAGAGKTSEIIRAAKGDWVGGTETIWISSRTAKIADDLGNALPDELRERIRELPNKKLEILVENGYGPKPGDRVVIDEIGVADVPTWRAIKAMLDQGVSVIALGDERQLNPIDHNGIATTLLTKARSLGHPSLDETRRCEAWKAEHDMLRSAVQGKNVDLDELVDSFQAEAFASVEEATKFISKTRTTSDILILAQGNDDRSAASAFLRTQARKILPDQPICVTADGDFAVVGDKLSFRQIVRVTDADGYRRDLAKTGETGEIIQIEENRVQLRFVRGKQVLEEWFSTGSVKSAAVFGDASTTAAAQGSSCEQAYVLLKGGEDGKFIYSAATRSRQKPIFLVVPPTSEGSGILSQAGITSEPDASKVLKSSISRQETQLGIFEALEVLDVAQRDQVRAEIKAKAEKRTPLSALSILHEGDPAKPLDMSRYRSIHNRHQALLKRRTARQSKDAEQKAEDLRATKQKREAETDQFVRSFFGKQSPQVPTTAQVKEDLEIQKIDNSHQQIVRPVESVENFVAFEQAEMEVSEFIAKKPRRRRGLGR
jgi:hypothetical protein